MKHCQTPTPQSTLRRRLTTYFVALTGACLAMLPQGLYASDSLSFPLPIEIKVPAGHMPFLRGHAVGTQNYMCLPCPSTSPSSLYLWLCLGPHRAAGDSVQRLWDTNHHPFSESQPGGGRHAPCHMAGLSGYQRGLGKAENERDRCRESECDSLATARGGRIGGRAHRGGPAHGDHIYPSGEYHRRPGTNGRLCLLERGRAAVYTVRS